MVEKDWKYVQGLLSDIERWRHLKRLNIEAIQKRYLTESGTIVSFPAACKQPMTDILVAYYDREIAMVQAKLDAIEIRFGKTDDKRQMINESGLIKGEYPDPRTPKETGPMTANTISRSDPIV
jgi:hypothetical protein